MYLGLLASLNNGETAALLLVSSAMVSFQWCHEVVPTPDMENLWTKWLSQDRSKVRRNFLHQDFFVSTRLERKLFQLLVFISGCFEVHPCGPALQRHHGLLQPRLPWTGAVVILFVLCLFGTRPCFGKPHGWLTCFRSYFSQLLLRTICAQSGFV